MAANSIRFLICLLAFGVSLGPLPAFGQAEGAPSPQSAPTSTETEEPAEESAEEAPEEGAESSEPIFNREEQLFLLYAWYLVFSNRIDMIELSDKEKQAFLVGINLGLQQRSLTGWEERMPEVRKLMDDRWQPVYQQLQRERKAQTVEMFADLANREEVIKTPSGLFYELISEGTGKFATDNDVVNAEFTAKLIDGTVFETTEGQNGPIPLVLKNMVPGVREGLKYVREGGIIKLWVPSELGFGSEEAQGIPSDSALLFEFTIHEVTPVPESQQ